MDKQCPSYLIKMLNQTYPLYLERGGEQAIPPPYQFKNVGIHNFLIPANIAKLQSLCDRALNFPTHRRITYRVAMPYVLLAFVNNARLYSLNPQYQKTGWISEVDVGFWIPTLAYEMVGGVPIPQRLVWFMPYLFVDNASAMVAGREIYGFHKMAGELVVPSIESPADFFAVETMGIKQFAPESQWTRHRLLEVRCINSNVESPPQTHWTTLEDASRQVGQLFAHTQGEWVGKAFAVAARFFKFSTLETIPIVFLKQFRDVQDCSRACYQAIVEAKATVNSFQGGGLLSGRYELVIHHLDSHPLAENLGLKVGQQPTTGAFWLNYDFTMETGKEVWKA
jgi:hypothetical protein